MPPGPRTRRLATLAAAAGAWLAAGPVHAQSAVVAPGLLFPNTDRVLVGETEALEGGAFVAREGGPAANWYNPAGLALTRTASLSISSGGWEFQTISASRFSTTDVSQSLTARPAFAGFVLAPPLVDWEDVRLGLSVTNFAALRPHLDAETSRAVAGGTETVAYATQSQLAAYRFAVGAGWRLSGAWRLGGSLNVNYLYLQRDESLRDELLVAGSPATSLQSQVLSGRGANLSFSIGAQWEPVPWLVLGALLTTPGLHAYGYTSISHASQTLLQGTTVVVDLRDKRASYDFHLPVQASLGVALRGEVGALEVDVRYHSAQAPYVVAATGVPARITTLRPDGSTSVAFVSAPPYTAAGRTVFNVAAGGRVTVTPKVSLHAGFFTDLSPVAPSENPLFQAVDLYGVTGGASFQWSHFSGSIGAAYTWGQSGDLEFRGLLGGPAYLGSIEARILSLLLALSYRA